MPCPADSSFVAYDRAAGGPVGPGSTGGDDTDEAAHATAALDDRIGLGEQIAADLLPEAAEPGEVGP